MLPEGVLATYFSSCLLENPNSKAAPEVQDQGWPPRLPERAGKPGTPQPSLQHQHGSRQFKWLTNEDVRKKEKKERKKDRNHMHFPGPGLGLPTLGHWPHQVPHCLAAQTQDSCKVPDLSGPLTRLRKVLDLFPAPGTSAGREWTSPLRPKAFAGHQPRTDSGLRKMAGGEGREQVPPSGRVYVPGLPWHRATHWEFTLPEFWGREGPAPSWGGGHCPSPAPHGRGRPDLRMRLRPLPPSSLGACVSTSPSSSKDTSHRGKGHPNAVCPHPRSHPRRP